MHEEVLRNLCSIHGALLCMNRSIQAEGTYGIIKNDKQLKPVLLFNYIDKEEPRVEIFLYPVSKYDVSYTITEK